MYYEKADSLIYIAAIIFTVLNLNLCICIVSSDDSDESEENIWCVFRRRIIYKNQYID